MSNAPLWDREGRDWPNRCASQFVQASGLRWHVQIMGRGPVLLLVHGTGAATHSWRDFAPILARYFTIVAPDLPGHGFSAMPPQSGLSLPGMARGLAALLHTLQLKPALAVGHSAGAAILARMCMNGDIVPSGLVSLNGAFLPLTNGPGRIFTPVAKLLARIPVVPHIFAWHVSNRAVAERLMRSTGSTIDAAGMDYYTRLMRRPDHPAAALGMMANWDLVPLQRELPRLRLPLLLIVGSNDRSISPAEGDRVARLVPGAKVKVMQGLGHLAHEEQPGETAALVEHFAQSLGVLMAA